MEFAEDFSTDNINAINPMGFVSWAPRSSSCLLEWPCYIQRRTDFYQCLSNVDEKQQPPRFASLRWKAVQYPSAIKRQAALLFVICESRMLYVAGWQDAACSAISVPLNLSQRLLIAGYTPRDCLAHPLCDADADYPDHPLSGLFLKENNSVLASLTRPVGNSLCRIWACDPVSASSLISLRDALAESSKLHFIGIHSCFQQASLTAYHVRSSAVYFATNVVEWCGIEAAPLTASLMFFIVNSLYPSVTAVKDLSLLCMLGLRKKIDSVGNTGFPILADLYLFPFTVNQCKILDWVFCKFNFLRRTENLYFPFLHNVWFNV